MTFNMNVHQPDESVYELLDLTKKILKLSYPSWKNPVAASWSADHHQNLSSRG